MTIFLMKSESQPFQGTGISLSLLLFCLKYSQTPILAFIESFMRNSKFCAFPNDRWKLGQEGLNGDFRWEGTSFHHPHNIPKVCVIKMKHVSDGVPENRKDTLLPDRCLEHSYDWIKWKFLAVKTSVYHPYPHTPCFLIRVTISSRRKNNIYLRIGQDVCNWDFLSHREGQYTLGLVIKYCMMIKGFSIIMGKTIVFWGRESCIL